MRKLFAVAVAIALVACGEEEERRPTGPMAGAGVHAFTPADGMAVSLAGSCMGVSGFAVLNVTVADAGGLCAMHGAGAAKAGMRTLGVGVMRMAFLATDAPPIGPGRYPIGLDAQPAPGAMSFDMGYAMAAELDAACGATGVEATRGTVWIDSVAGGRVTGVVEAELEDGTPLAGTFDAALCAGGSIDEACSGEAGTTAPVTTCMP